MSQLNADIIVIGQGLAGSLLAWQLRCFGRDVYLYDNARHHASSMVAGGLINPLTGQRLHADDNVQQLLQAARQTYRQLERECSSGLLQELPMQRFATSPLEQQRWQQRHQQTRYQDLIGDWLTPHSYADLNDEHGSFSQQQCARLDIPKLLDHIKQRFMTERRYRQQAISAKAINPESATLNDLRARLIIFCEGHQVIHNPWFQGTAWDLSQGDILRFACQQTYAFIANKRHQYVPLSNTEFHWGASFHPRPDSILPTESGMQGLLNALQAFDRNLGKYQLQCQLSGIRPGSRDKRPVIGFHPRFPKLAIFNGFGARGSLLIPFYAAQFARVLLGQQTLDADVDCRRFFTTQSYY